MADVIDARCLGLEQPEDGLAQILRVWPHVECHDIDLAALLPVFFIIPPTLLQTTIDHNRITLMKILATIISLLPQDNDIDETHLFFRIFSLFVLPMLL